MELLGSFIIAMLITRARRVPPLSVTGASPPKEEVKFNATSPHHTGKYPTTGISQGENHMGSGVLKNHITRTEPKTNESVEKHNSKQYASHNSSSAEGPHAETKNIALSNGENKSDKEDDHNSFKPTPEHMSNQTGPSGGAFGKQNIIGSLVHKEGHIDTVRNITPQVDNLNIWTLPQSTTLQTFMRGNTMVTPKEAISLEHNITANHSTEMSTQNATAKDDKKPIDPYLQSPIPIPILISKASPNISNATTPGQNGTGSHSKSGKPADPYLQSPIPISISKPSPNISNATTLGQNGMGSVGKAEKPVNPYLQSPIPISISKPSPNSSNATTPGQNGTGTASKNYSDKAVRGVLGQ
ncbi:hypothetical protein CROQUDRAFT_94781 [Cronartium quercuum f. sp. fusiforme G11]|uniref:Uncharacterized protein n=1 Tax=Cronartium quercuum f. sp. fusiforme G11 TaxID=708437 RepID=A0A9P6TBH8_9BASI|nr:hypothetical protein CROQUDRAFT_94781 [Cronartium quercuum f. sp. fusiforme G11]